MAEVVAIHECLFCPQTFDSAIAKDDHILEHFAQEICMECNRNLIRIGGSLCVKHDALTCIKWDLKCEDHIRAPSVNALTASNSRTGADDFERDDQSSFISDISMKIEEQKSFDKNSNDFIDFSNDDPLHSVQSSCRPTVEPPHQLPLYKSEPELQIEAEEMESNDEQSCIQGTIDAHTKKSVKVACEICGQTVNKSSLSKHNVLKHSSPNTKENLCRICGRLFSTIEDREAHRIKCAVEKKMRMAKKSHPDLRCDLCNKPFKSDLTYRKHMKQIHDQTVTKFKCDQCRATFLKESWLQEHQCTGPPARNITKRQFPCDICHTNFHSKQSVQRHLKYAHSTQNNFNCKICKNRFDTREELISHRYECFRQPRARKPRGSGTIQCDLCPSKFQSITNLRKHKKMVHDPSITKFTCTLCKAIFLNESSFKAHDCCNNHGYRCRDCGKKLRNLTSFRLHQTRFHSSSIFCEVCGRLFFMADERNIHQLQCKLKRQLRTQRSIGRFECDLCKKVYKARHDLRKHMRAKHDPDGDKFKCTLCKRVYSSQSTLQEHRCKGDSTNTYQKGCMPKIPCEICGKMVIQFTLKRHQTVHHSAPGTIYCSTCYKVFANNDDLDAHRQKCTLRVKTPKKCDICDKVLANPNVLVRHKISFHSEPTVIFCKTCVKKFKTVDELNAHMPECALKRKFYNSQKRKQLPEDNIG